MSVNYSITVRFSNSRQASGFIHRLMREAEVLKFELLEADDGEAISPLALMLAEPPKLKHPQKICGRKLIRPQRERNQEIIDKYLADPRANTSEMLAQEYGLSRERVCQILRGVNAIAMAKGRREIARKALAHEADAIAEQAAAEWGEKLEAGIQLMREEKLSGRQAAKRLGFPAHSGFTHALMQRARAAGLKMWHGRHRDFSERRARVRALSAEGLTVSEIVAKMRKDGSDPKINASWIYSKMPECKTAGSTVNSGPTQEAD